MSSDRMNLLFKNMASALKVHRLGSTLVLVVVFGVLGSAVAWGQTTLLFGEDFEDETVNDYADGTATLNGTPLPWNPDSDDRAATWDNDIYNPALSGVNEFAVDNTNIGGNTTNKLHMDIGDPGDPVFIGGNFTASSDRYVTVEYDVYMSDAPPEYPAGEILYADADGDAGNIAIHLQFNDRGNNSDGDNASNNSVYRTENQSYRNDLTYDQYAIVTDLVWNAGAWYRVRVVADNDDKAFDVRIEDIDTGSSWAQNDMPYNDSGAGPIEKMWFGLNATAPDLYFDNIQIYEDTSSPNTFTWTGGGTAGDWDDTANWDGGEVPPNDGSAIVIIENTGNDPVLPRDYSLASLAIDAGATLTVGANALDMAGALTVGGTLDNGDGGGEVIVDGNADFTGGAYTKGGLLRFDGGGGQQLTSDGNDLGDIRTSSSGTDLQLQDAGDFDVVTIEAGTTVTTGTNTISTTDVTVPGTLDAGAQGGTETSTIAGAASVDGAVNFGAGAADIDGSVTGAGDFTASSGTTNVGGDFTIGGTYANNGGTMIFDTTDGSTVNGYSFSDVTVNANTSMGGAWTVNNALTVGGGATLTTGANALTVDAGATVDGTLDATGQTGSETTGITGSLTGTGTATFGGGDVTVSADVSVATFSGGPGAVDIGGDVSGTAFTESSTTTNIAGTTVTFGAFTSNGGTVTLDSGATTALTSAGAYNNVTIPAGTTVSLQNDMTVGGTLTVNGVLELNGSTLTLNNDADISNVDSGTGTIAIAGTVGLTSGGSEIYDLTISASGTLTPQDAITVNRNVLIENGGTYTNNGQALTLGGTSAATGDVTDSNGGTEDLGDVTLNDADKSLQTDVSMSSLDVASSSLTMGANTLSVGGGLSVGGSLDNGDTGGVVIVDGNADFTGGAYSTGGLLRFDGGGGQQLTSDGNDLGDIRTSTSGTDLQLQDAGDFDAVTVDAGTTLDAAGNDMNVGGDWTNAGSFASGTNLTTFDATSGPVSITTGGTGTGGDFHDLTFDDGGNGVSFVLETDALDADGDLTITNGTLDISNGAGGPHSLTVGGTFNNNDRLLRAGLGETAPSDDNSGVVEYDGAGGTIEDYGAGNDYNNLEISANQTIGSALDTAGYLEVAAGTLTVDSTLAVGTNLDVSGSLSLNADVSVGVDETHTLTIASGGTITVNAAETITVNGNWDNQGTFDRGTGTVDFDAPAQRTISITGDTAFYRFLRDTGDLVIEFGAGDTFSIEETFEVTGGGPADIESRDPATYSSPPWEDDVILTTTSVGTQWFFDLDSGADIILEFVFVDWSNSIEAVTLPSGNLLGENTDNWFTEVPVSSSATEDQDENGRIDQIRVVLPVSHNDDFSDFEVRVSGYDVTGFESDSTPDDEFLILLEEKPYLDTDATPEWEIVENVSLVDSLTGTRLVTIDNLPDNTEVPDDAAAPLLAYTLTYPEATEIFVTFSEPVYGSGQNELTAGDFGLSSPGGQSITGLVPVTPSTPTGSGTAYEEFLLTLSSPISVADVVRPAPGDLALPAIEDAFTAAPNPLLEGDSQVSISSVAIAPESTPIVTPVFARDETIRSEDSGGAGLIRDFDGSEFLAPEDITLQAFRDTALSDVPNLYGDSDVSSNVALDGFWLPYELPGLTLGANTNAFDFGGAAAEGQQSEHSLRGDNSRIRNESMFEFVFNTGVSIEIGNDNTRPLYAARLATERSTPWYRNVRPWTFEIAEIVEMRGNVSITSNIIDPTQGDETHVQYELEDEGMVTVNVLNLAGDLVDVLHRGRQSEGQYQLTWDGRNRRGSIVARGLYFIRVVGPGFDEYRNVMVVR